MARRKKKPGQQQASPSQPGPKAYASLVEVCPEDFAPFSHCEQRLTQAQARAIRNMAHYQACLMRRQGHWSEQEEAAFLNGAASVFLACQSEDQLPDHWWLDTLPLLVRLALLKERGLLSEGG
jgi:hypothetical protein